MDKQEGHLNNTNTGGMTMQNKSILLSAALAVISVVCVILAISSTVRLKNTEAAFNEKQASFLKENLDLKDRLSALQESASKYDAIEKEKLALDENLRLLKEENEKIKTLYRKLKLGFSALISARKNLVKQLMEIKNENIALSEKVSQLVRGPLVPWRGKDKLVSLSPIVVKGKTRGSTGILSMAEKKGKVVSIDKENNLLVVDIGLKEEVKKGDRCVIIKDDQQIASGEIINVRSKMSAVFVDDLKYENKISDIKAGYEVLID